MSALQNPFTLTFGKEPASFISREKKTADILEVFLSEQPETQVLMLTGVRGSGKTVMLTSIANELRNEKDWIVVDLNPELNMLQMLAAELSNYQGLSQMFKDAKINLSLFGIDLSIKDTPPITDVSIALDRMLSVLAKRKKKVLVTIDEATSTRNMREFVAQFQIYLRKNYNVFLLMTGLFENVNELQNEKSLTFLYRAPKVEMTPLSITLISKKYAEVFHLSGKDAMQMAKATNGYAYAFQLLGYLCFKYKKPYQEIIKEYDAGLEEYVYEKMWSELSPQDQMTIRAIALTGNGKVEKIREKADMSSSSFSVYRNRLIKKGLIRSEKYGYVEFTLPQFREFILRMIDSE